jgi:hypothetical protein
MSAIDDFLSTQPQASSSGAAAPQTAAGQSVPPALRAPQMAQPQGVWQVPGGFTMGLGDIVRGGVQDLVHGISWAADKIAPNSQFAQDARAALPQMQQTIDAQNAQYAAQRAASQAPTLSGLITGERAAPGFDWARLGGNVVGTLPVMAMGSGEGLLGRLGMGALQSGLSGALMPTTGNSDLSFGQQKAEQTGLSGLLGAATPLAAAGARAAGRGLWNAIQPVVQPTRFVGQGLANAMDQGEAAQAAANIRGAQQFVPGSLPTTAQVAQTPLMVQTEKAAANIPAFKTAMAQRAIDNNNARWQALMNVAQTPEALQAAQAAREDATFPLYAAAGDQTANAGKGLIKLFQRPALMQAAQQADQLAANRGETLIWPQQGGDMSINGRALDYTNRALGDMIGSAKASGNKELASGLADAQSQLQSWMTRYIPAQRQAAQAYAQMSVPINTMEAGQAIANGLGTRAMNAGGVPEIQLMPYRSALTSAMKNAPYGIDSNALQTLQGIGQDLQRATVSNSIRSPGSDTAYNLAANGWLARQLYGPTFGGGTPLGRIMAGSAAALAGHPLAGVGIASGMGKVGQMVGGRLQDRLTGLLMDPNAILPFLDARAAAPAQAIPGPLMQGLLNYGRPAVVNGLIGGFQNPGNK